MLRQRSTIIRLNSGSKVTVQTRSELTSKRTRLLYEPMPCIVSMESARGGGGEEMRVARLRMFIRCMVFTFNTLELV